MTRRHRLAHRLVWPALAVAVALGFTLALTWRPAAAAPWLAAVSKSAP